jgi:hypothetical protein
MKYMTKEWYETAQKCSFHLPLKVSKKAEVFSIDYFRNLYKSEEKAWLRLQENVSDEKFEDIYPDEFQAEYYDGRQLEPSEFEKAKKVYFEMREQARLDFINPPAFDPIQEKKNFKQALQSNVKYLKRNLPDEILQQIADIRVLALDRASADIKKEITAYCKVNEKAVDSAINAYWKEYKMSFKNGEPTFAENFNFHDCIVVACRKKGKDIVLTLDNSGVEYSNFHDCIVVARKKGGDIVLSLDNSGGFTTINQIIFKNCSILKKDKPLHGAWWLYDEIYKTNDGYEIHTLLDKNGKLIDFIVYATDVWYK